MVTKWARFQTAETLGAATWLIILGLLANGCDEAPRQSATQTALASIQVETNTPVSTTAPPDGPSDSEARRRFDEALALPGLPGAPNFEKQRAIMVARAKSEPVFFIEAPSHAPTQDVSVAVFRKRFATSDFSWREVRRIKSRYRRRPDKLREVLLPNGYLYAEEPNQAFALVSLLKPSDLFNAKEIWVHRGSWRMHAERGKKGNYRFTDGPEEGAKVRLLHLDRVGTGTIPEPLHRDFRGLRYRLFFDRARVQHITKNRLVAELRYGSTWVPTLLESDGASLNLVAEIIKPELRQSVLDIRKTLAVRAHLIDQLRVAMRAQIDEALPFDEPKTEVGQQDGILRRHWRRAYLQGKSRYEFNDDWYQVFDRKGRARPPQVCIDFMVDTLERASGTWWADKSAPKREKRAGLLELREGNRGRMRRTKGFLAFAREHESWFDIMTFPKHKQIELGYKRQFFSWLAKQTEHFEPGDIVFIRGLTPWDEVDEHTHSFFVYETDPLSGMPIAIAGNAGPANLWSWETEARRTPHRTLRDRIRLSTAWLESFLSVDLQAPLSPPALISGKR